MNSEVTTFSSVEQLESAAQATGWQIEYRQLRPGTFHSWFTASEVEGISVAVEEFGSRLQVVCEPPKDYFGIMLPRFKPGRAVVMGQDVIDGDMAVFPNASELEILTRGQMQNLTLFLKEEDFLACARSLVPGKQLFASGSAHLARACSPTANLVERHFDAVLRAGHADAEAVSNLLASIIMRLSQHSPADEDWQRDRHAISRIARRARDYIEAHYHGTIRMQDLCNCTGIGLRTLQRCFAKYYEISPCEYIKARRLNAVHRELVLEDPSHGSVTDIALRNGLPHLGRFSSDYRVFFGESPSETLRRRWPD